MKKIPSLFIRDMNTHLITPLVTPGCEWVINGEGVATVKYDGTSCLVRDGRLYKRYDAKHGKTPPQGFEPAQAEADPITGHWPGWLLVGDEPDSKYHNEAWETAIMYMGGLPDWTYELVGPKVQSNPYNLHGHELWRHGEWDKPESLIPPRSFDELRAYFEQYVCEGFVWWRDINDLDCDKVKIKRRDFGLPWPVKVTP